MTYEPVPFCAMIVPLLALSDLCDMSQMLPVIATDLLIIVIVYTL